jgi:hypothetical protein
VTQPIAAPEDEPQPALVATCRCQQRITRLSLESARWRHDDGTVTCPPADPPFRDLVLGRRPR